MSENIITTSLVRLDVDLGTGAEAVIRDLAQLLGDTGRATSAEQLTEDVLTREASSSTGVPGGIAIPHCRSAAVVHTSVVFARLSRPVDFGAKDGPADLVFLLTAPAGSDSAHLKLLSTLARALLRREFLNELRAVSDRDTAARLIEETLFPPVIDSSAPVPAPAPNLSDSADPGPAPRSAPRVPGETRPGENPADQLMADPMTGSTGSAGPPTESDRSSGHYRIVAVTACPTGIAHTYMAADALLQRAAARGNVELTVETQGSAASSPVAPAVISGADVVILAADIEIEDKERFTGMPVITTGVRRALHEPDAVLDAAITVARESPATRPIREGAPSHSADRGRGTNSWARRIQQAVMTGVSYMIPFIAAGGLLMALGYLVGGPDIAGSWSHVVANYSPVALPPQVLEVNDTEVVFNRSGLMLYLGAALFGTGALAMQLIVPALSGFIAYGLAGRPGIAPGFIGGAISIFVGAGFIGALVTGILAGLLAWQIGTWRVPRLLASLVPMVLSPLLSTLVVGLVMFGLLGRPLAGLMSALTGWLGSLGGASAILLGVVLGLMMCVDLGGPVNKSAYLFATAGLSTGTEAAVTVMAAVMAAGMVPPIAMSGATMIRAELFTPAERENGKSAWLLGLSFITEGAIPFAAADPFRVLPSLMVGGAAAGAVSMALLVGSQAPHGGVFVLFAVDPWWGLLLAVLIGSLVSTLAVLGIKTFWPPRRARQIIG